MNHKGMPDVNRGARYILKDYVAGKLLFCYPPPDIDTYSFQEHRYEVSKEIKYLERLKKNQEKVISCFGLEILKDDKKWRIQNTGRIYSF